MDPELPPEMIFEVLIRTPLHTLDTCKKVSNSWKELIYDSTFFPFYLERTGTLFGFFVQDISNTKHIKQFVGVDPTGGRINNGWWSDEVRILASSNCGIVCCDKRKGNNCRWYIGKPTTEQWKTIPNPKLRRKTVGVAMIVSESKSLRFRIIRLSEMENKKKINCWLHTEYECEIFDSKTWCWRRTQSMYLNRDEFIDIYQPAITAGEFVYWKTSWNNILAFHVSQQKFNKFSLPQTDVQAEQLRLMDYQGRLGFSCTLPNGKVQLWLKNSGCNYEWTKKIDVDIRVLEETFTYPHLVGFCNTNTSFVKAFNKIIFFNVEDGTFSHKEINYELRNARQYFQFCSDVKPVDFRFFD